MEKNHNMDQRPAVGTKGYTDHRVADVTKLLEAEVKKLYESDTYRQYLATVSKFTQYSWNNCLLISLQRPDATLVAGYQAWQKKFGRQVERGEKGIKILAPTQYKEKVKREKRDVLGRPILRPDGKPETETIEVTRQAYRIAYVYDISQTSGPPIKGLDFGPKLLEGKVDRYDVMIDALKAASPVPIVFEPITSGANGYFNPSEGRIVIKEGMPEEQTIKTCFHEIAHSYLDSAKSDKVDRQTRECRAESVAFICCERYGIDSGSYSFPYLVGWSSGKELPELKQNLQAIQVTARTIIQKIDNMLEKQLEHKAGTEKMEDRTHDQGFEPIDTSVFQEKDGEGFGHIRFTDEPAIRDTDEPIEISVSHGRGR